MDVILPKLLPYFLMMGGLYSLINVLIDREAFFQNRKVRRMVALVGRKGARAFYFVFGSVMLGGGIYAAATGLFENIS